MKRRHLAIVLLVATALAVGTTIAASRLPTKKSAQQLGLGLDKNRWPITDYGASSSEHAAKALKRNKRSQRFNKSAFRVHPDDPSENSVIVDGVDANLPAFPLAHSSDVFIGTVSASQAFMAADQTGVYSEFAVEVNRVLKTADPQLSAGCVVELQRSGGRVKFRSGRTHGYSVDKENMPQIGGQYVFFVQRDPAHDILRIVTAYQLKNGKIEPLDELPQFLRLAGREEPEFLKDLQIAISAETGT